MIQKVLFIAFLILFSTGRIYAQADLNRNVEKKQYAYKIDNRINQFDSSHLKVDFIQIDIKNFGEKITATCLFEISQTFLTISYYFKNKELFFVSIRERSPKFSDMFKESLFFYEHGRIIDEEHSSTVRIGVLIPKNKSIYELYGYNQFMSVDFLTKFVHELYETLK